MRTVPESFLRTSLLELYARTQEAELSVVLGGGFGLFLKQLDVMAKENSRTLIPIDEWPQARTTNDLDLFVPMEVLVRLPDMQALRKILDEMGFKEIQGAEFWQFVSDKNDVKIDLLTGPIIEHYRDKLKLDSGDSRRVRPKGDLKLHARQTPEALALQEHRESFIIRGERFDGKQGEVTISVPSPFTYLMMKLTAFSDQVDSERRGFGQHHALDVYRIVAMLNEEQFLCTQEQFRNFAHDECTKRVTSAVAEFFGSSDSKGILRLREHPFYGANLNIPTFIDSLADLV